MIFLTQFEIKFLDKKYITIKLKYKIRYKEKWQ